MKPRVIAIVGPTASGKSSLAVWLAKQIQKEACGAEIISADSRQVYKGLNIGTGKITTKEMQGVPHHLLDVASPKKQFSADDFVKKGKAAIRKSMILHTIPIIVGGTGYYIDALLGRIVLPSVPPNNTLREQLEKKSTEQLFALLKKKDPRRAKSIEPDHKRRLIRALEIASALGVSPKKEVPAHQQPYDVLWIGVSPPEKIVQKNIHNRLLARIKIGMVAEAKRLHKQGLSYQRMHELGLEYKYLALYLEKKITKEEMLVQLERAINHYAKRQLRWFKRNDDILWIKNKTQALRLTQKFLKSQAGARQNLL